MKGIAGFIKTHRFLILIAIAAAFLGACETTPPNTSPEPATSKNVSQDSARTSAAKTTEAGAAKAKAGGGKSCD